VGLKTERITITADGRDKGKVFVITEMPARPAEKWATRVFIALAKAGIDVPDNIGQQGMVGIGLLTLKMISGIRFEDAEPLMDEMFRCVQIQPDPRKPEVVRPLIDNGTEGDDIEEVATRLRLRSEVINLHTGFSMSDALSKLTSASDTAEPASPNTKTSRASSAR